MLNATTVEKINRQIQDELRTVDSICSSHQEKLEAIERIRALKEIFADPKDEQTTSTTQPILLESILGRMFRNRI